MNEGNKRKKTYYGKVGKEEEICRVQRKEIHGKKEKEKGLQFVM